jgi:anti-sigma regulatory factor (Ser/Thr protein kinase)
MRIVISSQPKLLHILRRVVKYCAEEAGFSPADVDSMTLAIDEAAANVIRHAYGNRPDAQLAVEIHTFSDRIEFVLEDSGPKVREEAIRPRSLDDIRPGGLGTHFINSFIDESSYDRNYQPGNRLKMVKFLPRKVSPSDEGSSQKG